MTEPLFNTPEETATRLTLCLPQLKEPANIEEIAALDLVATYMQTFGYGEGNLHGNTPFARAEYDARRARVRKGLNQLVVRDLAATQDGGVTFTATTECETASRSLQGDYADSYRAAVKTLLESEIEMILRSATRVGDVHV